MLEHPTQFQTRWRCTIPAIGIQRPARRRTTTRCFRLACILMLAVYAGCSSRSLHSPAFPRKPIKIVVYTGPGGPIDTTARHFAKVASRLRPQATFVVENKPGDIVAMERVLQSRADGYTLFACTKSNISKLVSAGRESYLDRFDWIAMLMRDPECVITRRGGDTPDWNALIGNAHQDSQKQIWLGPARGGLDHVTAMQVWDRFQIDATWIPCKSGNDAILKLLTDQGVAYVGNPADAAGQPDLQVAIVSSAQRLPGLPDTPTFGEAGFPDLDQLYMWRGFALKKGCPPAAKRWYDELFEQVAADEEWKNAWEKDGIEVGYQRTAEFGQVIAANRQEFQRYLQRLNMVPTNSVGVASGWLTQTGLAMLALILFAHVVAAALLGSKHLWNRYAHVIIVSCLLCICGFLAWQTTRFPTNDEGVGAAFVPRLWIVLAALLGVPILFSHGNEKSGPATGYHRLDQVAKVVVLLAMYVVMAMLVGYYLSTFLFLLTCMYLLGERRWLVLVGVSVTWTCAAYLTFPQLLYVPLPTGRIFDWFS